MSQANDIETRDPNELTPHPRNDEIYDDEAEDWFVESIEQQGVLEPIVLTPESHCYEDDGEVIISGHRRTDAAKKAGLEEVPVRLEEYESELEEREAFIEYNKQREKTFSQKMRESDELMEIETERARKRMKQGGQGNQDLGDLSKGQTLDKVAERFDRSGEWLRQARKVWEYAGNGETWARNYVESIEDGDESVNSAYKAVQRRERLAEIDEEGAISIMAEDDREPEGDLLASFLTSTSRLKKLLRQCALDGNESHDDLYLEVRGEGNGEVRVLQSTSGESLLTYCSFYAPYLEDITLDQEGSVAVIANVDEIRKRLDSIGGDVVRVELRGEEGEPIALGVRLVSELVTWISTPTSGIALEGVPEWMPQRFTHDNVYANKQGDKAPTQIDTEVSQVEKIIWALENTSNPESKFYPIVVEDGEFRLRVDGEETYLHGLLAATVDGPDVENYYNLGFTEMFSVLSGPVELQTAPGNSPIAVVQEEHGRVIRHVLGSAITSSS